MAISVKENYKDGDDICNHTVYLASGKILVGNSSGEAAPVTPSGDVTMDNTGVYTLSNALLQVAAVSLTNAEMLALRATPKQLVAAPGAGYLLQFVSAVLLFDYTAAYTETTDNLGIRYENGSGTQVSDDIEATAFITATADTVTFARPKVDGITAASNCVNKALVLHNIGDGEWGGGNASNAVRVKTFYRVVTTGF